MLQEQFLKIPLKDYSKTMKITRKQLRRIIKEELSRAIREQVTPTEMPDPIEVAQIITRILAVLREEPELSEAAAEATARAAADCSMSILTGQDPVVCANEKALEFMRDNWMQIAVVLSRHPELAADVARLVEIAASMGIELPTSPE
jgi:hypothetical protein